jgi:iturin family lipopeptide synthetase A
MNIDRLAPNGHSPQTITPFGSENYKTILAKLSKIVAKLLKSAPEEVDIYAPFLEMGADSIVLIEAIHNIENSFGIKISIRQLFEELKTLDALAKYIERNTTSEVPVAENLPKPPVQMLDFLPPITNGKVNTTGSEGFLEEIISQQMQLMSQQLEILRGYGLIVEKGHSQLTPQTKAIAVNGANTATPIQQPSKTFSQCSRTVETHAKGMTPQQSSHLEDLIARYTQRTQKSKQRAQASRHHLADNRAVVGFRMGIKEMLYPIVGTRYQGAHFWDLDDNEYVDLAMGFGTHLFGHDAPFFTAAINEQLQKGVAVGPQPELALETAELLCELTGAERATFCQSGSESVMVALRLARTATKRDRIAIFTGSYHGHFDGVLAKPEGMSSVPIADGIAANSVKDVLVLNYGDPKALEILQAEMPTLAAVLVEPVQSRFPGLQPREFLHQLRRLTEAAGTALIFDEIITGFRIHPGGAQAYFGVQADLATYSKIFGGGLPLAAVAGKAKFMDGIDGGSWQFGDQSYPGGDRTFFAGTFNKHPLAMATCRAALKYLKEQGVQLQTNLNDRTTYLVEQLNRIFTEERVDLQVIHFGSLFRFVFTGNMDVFFYHLLEKGVYIWEGRTCFLSTAHTDADIDWIVRAVRESIAEMRLGGFFPRQQQQKDVTVTEAPAASLDTCTTVQEKDIQSHSTNQSINPAGFWERRKHKTATREKTYYTPSAKVEFSLYYFGNYESEFSGDKYDLLFTGAKFADRHEFSAVWIPERHFHAFGGFSPNPSVIAAALARETKNIKICSGSVVLPIHHPIRVVEEWSVVDNLSQGRVGISYASGWNPNDFVFAPQSFGKHRELMFQEIETVRKLWRGESISVQNGVGKTVSVQVYPKPMQAELQDWVTIVNNPDTFIKAGEIGAGVLTNLMGQSIADLADNIALYRESLAQHGYDPSKGRVTVLLHTFVGKDLEETRQQARQPLYNYFKSSVALFQSLAKSQGLNMDFDSLSEDDKDYILSSAYDRYLQSSALIGTPDSCAAVVANLQAIGVDEIACLIDFGVAPALVVENLPELNRLKELYQNRQFFTTSPLSAAQKQLWVLAQLSNDASTAYNVSVSLKLQGEIDLAALTQAMQQVVNRHAALRTSISPQGDVQQILPSLKIDLPLIDLSAENTNAQLQEWLTKENQSPFNLTAAPLFRVRLLKLAPEEHIFVFTAHHIIVDGWSVGVIIQELSDLYSAICQDENCRLPAPMQYPEYVSWQQQHSETPAMTEHENYWLQKFASSIPVLNLPTDRPRPPIQTYKGSRETIHLDANFYCEVKRFSKEKGCTPFMTLLSVYTALLHQLTDRDDIAIGISTAGRSFEGSERLVGYCNHLLPIRSCVDKDLTFSDYLKMFQGILLDAYEHQDYPFARLLDKLKERRNASQSPLVTAIFNMERPVAVPKMLGLETNLFPQNASFSRFDLSFNAIALEGELMLDCDYNTDLFNPATIQSILDRFQCLLDMATKSNFKLKDLSAIFDEADRQKLLVKEQAFKQTSLQKLKNISRKAIIL